MECKKLRPSKTATLDFVPVPRKIGDSLDVALEDHEDRCRPAAGEPCSSSSSGVAHLSMTSLCRVGDAGLDSNNDSLDVSIEETRDRSPRLFAFEDSSTLFREYLPPLRRTRRKPVLTEMSPVKNSTMNQSAMEAFSLHIDSVSPIDDENRKRRSEASPVDAHESIILQEKSAVEASATHDVPGHIRRFWRKIRTQNKLVTSPCVISVKSKMPRTSPSAISVAIVKRKVGGLGFLVRERDTHPLVVVSDIIKGGAAQESGLVEVGDVVLKVNSTDLTTMSYQKALSALRAAKYGQRVTLLLQVREGFRSSLVTGFDSKGLHTTRRITEPVSTTDSSKRNGNVRSK